jgi:hypothetical protein
MICILPTPWATPSPFRVFLGHGFSSKKLGVGK